MKLQIADDISHVDNGSMPHSHRTMHIVISIIVVIVVVVLIIAGICIMSNKKHQTLSSYAMTAQTIQKDTNQQYTKQDYDNDQKVLANTKVNIQKNGVVQVTQPNSKDLSTPLQAQISDNDKLLNDTLLGFKYSTNQIKNDIIEQTVGMNDYIKNHIGWPEDKYPLKDYKQADDLTQSIVDSFSTRKIPDMRELSKMGITFQTAQRTIAYAIAEHLQYNILDTQSKGYTQILYKWLANGHPSITNIQSINLEQCQKIYDGIQATYTAHIITTDGKTYNVDLYATTVYQNNNTNSYMKILDVY